MTHQPLVNAIVDVIFNEDAIRTTTYAPSNPLNEDQNVGNMKFEINPIVIEIFCDLTHYSPVLLFYTP